MGENKRLMEKYHLVPITHMIVGGSPRQGLAQQTVSEAAEASSRQSMSRTCSSMPVHTIQQIAWLICRSSLPPEEDIWMGAGLLIVYSCFLNRLRLPAHNCPKEALNKITQDTFSARTRFKDIFLSFSGYERIFQRI